MNVKQCVTLAAATLAGGVLVVAAAGTAKGTASYASKKGPVTVAFTHAALVTGPGFSKAPTRIIVDKEIQLAHRFRDCDLAEAFVSQRRPAGNIEHLHR